MGLSAARKNLKREGFEEGLRNKPNDALKSILKQLDRLAWEQGWWAGQRERTKRQKLFERAVDLRCKADDALGTLETAFGVELEGDELPDISFDDLFKEER